MKNKFIFLLIIIFLSSSILTSCKKRGEIILNSVTYEIVNCSLPYYVNFEVNLTYKEGDIAYHWDFGDGSYSEDKDPVHVYTTKGAYVVTLTIYNYDKTEVETMSVDIQNETIPVISDFDYTLTYNSYAPAEITFDNKSKYSATYKWEFGDGFTSTDFEPVYVFETAGNYEVKLYSICTNGDTAIHSEQIKILAPPQDIYISDVKVWLPSSNLNKSLRLKIYYDIFDETPSLLPDVEALSFPVSWSMNEEIYFFQGIYDSDMLKFEVWDTNSMSYPVYTFSITSYEIAQEHYPDIITFDNGSGSLAEVTLKYIE